MSYTAHFLVGGPCDGERVTLVEGVHFVEILPTSSPMPSFARLRAEAAPIDDAPVPEKYTRRRFRIAAWTADRIVYAHNSLDDETVVEKLWPSEFRRSERRNERG